MGKNNQWSKYTNEELIEMLRNALTKDNDIKEKDFGKLGLPSLKTYVNTILKLPDGKMRNIYKYFDLQYNPNSENNKKKYHCLEEMRNIALEQGFELLNGTFKSVNEVAHLKCITCGELKDIKYQYFIYDKTRCLNCTDSPRKFTYEQVKNYIEIESNSGCKLLETEVSYKRKLSYNLKWLYVK
jgi:hypothetical protein